VHWKAAARGGVLPVKHFEGAATVDVVLRLDDVQAADTEAALSQLAAWVLRADASGLHYALVLPGVRLPPASGPGHRDACLRQLALFGTPAA
jgi:uncharacterized protein (DUF58 family)